MFATDLIAIYPRLMRYALNLRRNYEQAEDLTQDTVMRAIEKEAMFDGINIFGWCCRIMYHRDTDLRRYAAKRRGIFVEFDDDDLSTPACQSDVVFASEVLRLVDALKPKRRRAMRLAAAGWHHREIASIMGCALGTAHTRVSRGRTQILERIGA